MSTEEEIQLHALQSQVKEAKACIAANHWALAGGYIDEGKSGTTRKNRSAYNRLFEDLYKDKFDIIVIKSQDRLMRNTKDWYIFIDALVSNKKQLYLYLDKRFYTPDDALLTGIKAILAEEYSKDLSKKIRNAHTHRQKEGKSILLTSATWGYDKIGKKIVVNKKEAEAVQMIFQLAAQGLGSRKISKKLTEKGFKSRNGGHFPEGTVRKIIRNPLFMGTAVMNKKTTDFQTKKTLANPKEEWIYHKNALPPIVPASLWHEANRLMDARSKKIQYGKSQKVLGKNPGKYPLSGKIICGACQSVYWRKHRRVNNGPAPSVTWCCSEYIKRGRKKEPALGGCNNPHLQDQLLQKQLNHAAEQNFILDKPLLIAHTMAILSGVAEDMDTCNQLDTLYQQEKKILAQKDLLLDKLLNGTVNEVDYKRKNSAFTEKLSQLSQKKALIQQNGISGSLFSRLAAIESHLNQTSLPLQYYPSFIKQIDKIILFTCRMEIHTKKSGVITIPL